MDRRKFLAATALAAVLDLSAADAALADDTVNVPCVCELSGAGAVAGTNFHDGAHMAVDEINAAGGILGKKIEMTDLDTQTDPQTSRALVQKAIEFERLCNHGNGLFRLDHRQHDRCAAGRRAPVHGRRSAEHHGAAQPLHFPHLIRRGKGVPALTAYFKDELKVGKIAIEWVNNDFGKGGHDVFLGQMKKAGIEVVANVSSEQGQVDFAPDVSKIKQSGAQAVFVYMNEEEDARFLKEAKKQGLRAPLVGEVTLTGQKVIDLAGGAAEGAIAHVGLATSAPIPSIENFVAKFKKRYNRDTDHNGIKGYIGVYAIKYATELVGKFDRKALADKIHGLTLDVAKYPNMLLTTSWDENGELSRESFMT